MAIQIINCPSCDTFLLDDTAECPECGHVVNADRAANTQRRSLPTDAAVDGDMEACPKCGETCRQGLVRCWSCGTFLRPEIEASYLRRRESTRIEPMQTFDMEVIEESSVTEMDSIRRRHLATPESLLAAAPLAFEEDSGDDDFELADDVRLSEIDEDAFDLAETVHLRAEGDEADVATEPTFRLRGVTEFSSSPVTPPVTGATDDGDRETIPLMPVSATAADTQVAEAFAAVDPAEAAASAPKVPAEDELLKIAADEEAEIARIRKAATTKATFVVYCPQGHRIRVREKFRGKTGKCPKCESAFVVPLKPKPNAKKKTDHELATVNAGDAGTASTSGRYARWLTDVRLHTVVPEKLKLKADSLLNEFQSVDLGIAADDLLLVTLVASAGMFGSNLKKKPAIRTALLEHLAKPEASIDGLAVATKRQFAKETFAQLAVVQPAPVDTESLFGNIPVFGAGRIAVRLPKSAEDKHAQYLSFMLSEFRTFAQALRAICGLEGLGANTEIPLADHYETYKCHYSDVPVLDLVSVDYYRKDPAFKMEIGGWKCSGCGLIVSEDARKKEKLGGLNGKGLAKAKCPKCTQKFGSNALVQLAATEASTPPAAAVPVSTSE
ncbi:MAG: hypothetical protein AABP62_04890 [Planctomycetota bacterium]